MSAALMSTREQLEAWSQEVEERTPESESVTAVRPGKPVKVPQRKAKKVADDEPADDEPKIFFKRQPDDDGDTSPD